MDVQPPIRAEVRYVNAEWKGRKEIPRIGSRETRRANTSRQPIKVHDARPGLLNGDITLDGSGFTLAKLHHEIKDFRDIEATAQAYYPAVEELVVRVSGAKKAFVRDHLVRTEVPIDFNDGYARFVHCDYNMKRLKEMSEAVLSARGIEPQKNWIYAWFNTWQPFDNPAINNPLAFIDWRSLPEDDVIDYFYTGRNRDSLVAAPVYNPDHVWRYVPSMKTDEILVFKQMDGRRNTSVYCPHTSFDNTSAPDNAPPRRSVETRLLAVFEED
ncbi:MAG: CmcJ/NvfI family oxidoreductase [Rhodospirillales bacterium]